MIATLAAVLAVAAGAPAASSSKSSNVSHTASDYLLNCGGCHGIEGKSSDSAVPTLRGQVGYFLCVPEGRSFIVRLPNVALAPVSDAELADMMNFIVGFGSDAEPRGPRYTTAEVADLRSRPLVGQEISAYRSSLVKRMISKCGAPPTLNDYK